MFTFLFLLVNPTYALKQNRLTVFNNTYEKTSRHPAATLGHFFGLLTIVLVMERLMSDGFRIIFLLKPAELTQAGHTGDSD
jgi:hypothetical protein